MPKTIENAVNAVTRDLCVTQRSLLATCAKRSAVPYYINIIVNDVGLKTPHIFTIEFITPQTAEVRGAM